ncbi:MAG: PH domain-containing protein [Bacilli bacterium]|nr:PH domain-containing protein [Bacilli bacterium]
MEGLIYKEEDIYKKLKEFKYKFPMTVCWRLRKHAQIIALHLNPGEHIKYIFAAQKNDNPFDIISTYAVVLTNKRILLASKRMLFGYFFTAITPDMFNDIEVKMGLIWGKVVIDTVKEVVTLSNIQREALDDIETNVTEYMMDEKQKYFGKSRC